VELGKHLLPVVLNVGIAMAIFSYALKATSEDLDFLVRERRLMGLSLISIFIVTPAIAVAVVEWISMPGIAKLAIVSLSFSIIPPTLPHKQFAAGGRRPYANALTLTVAILAIPFVPLLVDLSGRASHHPYGVPAGEIAAYVFGILAIPLILGLLFRWRWRCQADRFAQPLKRLAFVLTTVAIAVTVLASLPSVWHLIGTGTVLGMALFTAASMAIGHLMGGPDPGDELVLGLSSATRHPAIALTVASVNYPEGRVSSALVLCLIVNAIIGSLYVRLLKKRWARGSPAAR
jgi:BASS family bile acid:Na+ symporter